MTQFIRIKGARENNLKNISLDIPKHRLVVVTGPSGSGKSTLAMDILQRECQRQYMESSGLSSESIEKPQVDSIIGLSPSISVSQHVTNRNPRSTVGTVTDMYTYLRVVFEKKGERHCRKCQAVVPSANHDETESVHCPDCRQPHTRLMKSDFSFNTQAGACPVCSGLGTVVDIDIDSVFDRSKSIKESAVTFWYSMVNDYQTSILAAAGNHYGFEIRGDQPLDAYTQVQWDLLLHGVENKEFSRHFPDTPPPKTVSKGKFEGVLTGMWRRYMEKDGQSGEAAYFVTRTCTECGGERLKKESRNVTAAGKTLPQLSACSLDELAGWIEKIHAVFRQEGDALLDTVMHDLLIKVQRVVNVGLGYLSLDRNAVTLSGGEAQRLRLASILGSGLTGVLYVLDEPTSGLHPKDTDGLIHVMKQLRDLGNTVLIIEHDKRVMEAADYIIDVGPGAGRFGGEIVGEGTLPELLAQPESVTGTYLNEKRMLSSKKRTGNGDTVTVHKAVRHNLKSVTATFPLGCLVTVSGVSGSGKSTLVFDILASLKEKQLHGQNCAGISGAGAVQTVIEVNQTPLSRMQRSNVSTYIDAFTLLRNVFAKTAEAKARGFTAKNFSFNTPGGRCDRCEGLGLVSVNMHFLSHLQVTCPDCQGKRYNQDILTVTYKGLTIADILDLSIEESLPLFSEQAKLHKLLALLYEVGLGYLQWGQPVTTLSGGEAQRLKLAKELSKSSAGHTLYVLDEPTSGLHISDVQKLYLLLDKLVEAGNTVIMVEHNMDMIAASDWIIDMDPGGGTAGGTIVASGRPQDITVCTESFTGQILAEQMRQSV